MKVEKTLERMTVMDQNARKTREDTRSCNVFISWTGYDKALKEKIKAYLDANGVYCPDSEEACAGQFEDWSRESGGTGTVFLLLLTPNSANSEGSACRVFLPIKIFLTSHVCSRPQGQACF